MINKIIGIGDGGSQIAEHFKKYYDYSVLSASEKGDIKIPTAKKVEDLEDKMFSTKKKWSKTLKAFAGDDDLLFIVNGAAKSSAISLVLMEEVKENLKSVIFVKSDPNTINGTAKLQQRASLMVMQEFTRSGLIEKMFIVDNLALEKISPDVNILNYYEQLNDLVVSTFHMINFCKDQRPVLNTTDDPVETARIATFGAFNVEDGEKKLFYSLDFPRETSYTYVLNDEALREPARLMNIKDINTAVNKAEPANASSFVIYRSDLEHNYGYIVQYSTMIQEQLIEDQH
tara:strand:- start:662 stop:1522 length:861 start_codon:yes stop_codon:yes gene_type:complete